MGWKLSIVGKDEKGELDPHQSEEFDTIEGVLMHLSLMIGTVDIDLIREIIITKVH